jgi:hypothetical protein
MRASFFLLSLFFISSCAAQNTMQFPENGESPKANLDNVAWIAGHWKGEAFGGITEEIWSPPLGESMMFVFKLIIDNKVSFYEIGHIKQVDGTLLLQLKHFSGALKGWEQQEETVDFRLVKIEKDKVFFDQFTFEKISDNEINLYVVIGNEDGTAKVEKFNYKRQ